MKMKKHFLAGALALSVGVGAASLPSADVKPPTTQLSYVSSVTLPALWLDALAFGQAVGLPWTDSAGCGPYDLDHRCTGVRSLFDRLRSLRDRLGF